MFHRSRFPILSKESQISRSDLRLQEKYETLVELVKLGIIKTKDLRHNQRMNDYNYLFSVSCRVHPEGQGSTVLAINTFKNFIGFRFKISRSEFSLMM